MPWLALMFNILILLVKVNLVIASNGLDPICEGVTDQPETVIEVKNMPKVRSQDSIGVCHAFAVATLMDHAICKYEKFLFQGADDCVDMPLEKKMSPLDFTRYQSVVDGDKRSHRLDFFGLKIDGGNVIKGLRVALNSSESFAQESCVPFDRFVSKIPNIDEAIKVEKAQWSRLNEIYEKNKKPSCFPTPTDSNPSCKYSPKEKKIANQLAQELTKTFLLPVTEKLVLDALKQNTYNLFLDYILVPEHCLSEGVLETPPSLSASISVDGFRPGNQNYTFFIETIKEQLKLQNAVGVIFCDQGDFSSKMKEEDCVESHSLVIKGFKIVCDENNACKDVVQVHNSWGQPWQDNNCDGWVDAKEIIDRTFYNAYRVFWLTI